MNPLNSWRNEDNDINWIPYPYTHNSTTKQSDAQRSYRMKFSLANSILSLIREVIKVSFVKHDKGRRSGYNTAVGSFMAKAVRGDYPNLEVNFSAMEVSRGTLPGLSKWEFSLTNEKISLSWIFETNKTNAYGDDSVQLILFNLLTRSFTLVVDIAKRSDERIDYFVHPSQKGDYVAWVFVSNRNQTNSSNSHFLGRFDTN